MAYLKLTEPVVTALAAELTSGLPTVISEINAAVTDGYTLATPLQILDYVPSRSDLTGLPVVGVQDLPARFQDDIGSSATGIIELGVIVFLAHPERRGLARLCRRWQQAVATVALSGRMIGTAGYGVTLREAVPGPTLEREEDPRGWESFTGVIVRCFTDED